MFKRQLGILMILFLTVLGTGCKGQNREVKIAVIDTGISSEVIDAEKILPGKNLICPGEDTQDVIGHGTSVCGFITGDKNGLVKGVFPEAKLIPLVYATQDSQGNRIIGEPEVVADAIYAAVDEFHADLILIASGTKGRNDKLYEAVLYAYEKNVLVVSCAGNDGESDPEAVYYPGGYEEVLCVGAYDEDLCEASFSQKNDTVDILAEGCDLRLLTLNGKRIRGEGTSFSAAIVAAEAGKILSDEKGLTPSELIDRILDESRTEGNIPMLFNNN